MSYHGIAPLQQRSDAGGRLSPLSAFVFPDRARIVRGEVESHAFDSPAPGEYKGEA